MKLENPEIITNFESEIQVLDRNQSIWGNPCTQGSLFRTRGCANTAPGPRQLPAPRIVSDQRLLPCVNSSAIDWLYKTNQISKVKLYLPICRKKYIQICLL